MAIDMLLQAGGVLTFASIIGSLPMASQRSRLKAPEKTNGRRSREEKEFGPPSEDDFLLLWDGLSKVRRSEFYGLSDRSNVVTDRDVVLRVSALCRRAGWGVSLERKLIMLARKKDAKAAERFMPGRGFFFGAKSRIMDVECKKVLKHFKRTGLIEFGQPVFEFVDSGNERIRRGLLARAIGTAVGKPNDAITGSDQKSIYEFFSLNVHQVATEQGRYDLMKGCAEITTDSKLGIAHIRLFQRWGDSLKQQGQGPDTFLPTDEEYEGSVFMQDDVVYTIAFKTDRAGSRGDNHGDHATRRNMIALVLSGLSRDGDGFHKKMTGGQLGQGIAGTVGILSAPCVFYRVGDRGDRRLPELIDEIKKVDPQYWTRISEGKSKESLNFEALKWDSGFIDLLNGVDQRYKGVMSDLDYPLPPPSSDEEGGPEIVIGGR